MVIIFDLIGRGLLRDCETLRRFVYSSNEVNTNLMEHMTKIYHGSVTTEATLLKKIEDVEESVKNLNENFDAMTVQLEDVQEKMYDFEQNKKNNLIFYGVPGDNRESKDDLKHKISNLLKLRLNIRRDIPLVRASRMLTGTHSPAKYLHNKKIFAQVPECTGAGPRW